jgi:hypothetical protein
MYVRTIHHYCSRNEESKFVESSQKSETGEKLQAALLPLIALK